MLIWPYVSHIIYKHFTDNKTFITYRDTMISILQNRKLRHRKVKQLAQGEIAGKRQRQDSGSGCRLQSVLLPSLLCISKSDIQSPFLCVYFWSSLVVYKPSIYKCLWHGCIISLEVVYNHILKHLERTELKSIALTRIQICP